MVADALGPPAATRVVVPGQPPTVTPPAIAPGMVHIEVDPDAPYVAGHLSAADLAKATAVLAYLRERGVLVTACATGEQIVLVIARPIAQALLARIDANAALLRAALACPHCGRRHSLSPPFGWCWPCSDDARQGPPGPCAFIKSATHNQQAGGAAAGGEIEEEE